MEILGNDIKNSWGMTCARVVVGIAKPITNSIRIPGASTDLDITEINGFVTYENRELSIELHKMNYRNASEVSRNDIVNKINGRYGKIKVNDEYYFNGRVRIDAIEEAGALSIYKIKVSAEPYKYKTTETSYTFNVEDSKVVELYNECMPVIPTIITDADFILEYEGITLMIDAGESRLPDILLKAGINQIKCTGTGSITFTYREGAL